MLVIELTMMSDELYLSHTQLYRVNVFSAFNPSKWFSALPKGLTSVVDTSCQSRDSNPLPWVSSPTLYPLGHDCPDTLNVFVVAEGEDIWVPMAKRLLILPDGSAHSGGLHRHRLVQLRYRAIGLFLTHCMNQWPCSFTAWLNKASVRRKKGFSRSDFRQDVVRSGVSTGNLNLFSLKDCFKIEISSNVRPSCG